jgi:hypothetical protein
MQVAGLLPNEGAARGCGGRWWGIDEEWRFVAVYAIVIRLLGESSCQPLPPPF